jgi:thiamine-triphosphatase
MPIIHSLSTLPPRRIEVERKFRPAPVLLGALSNSTTKTDNNFRSVKPLGSSSLHDIYFDLPQRALVAQGLYIRTRNGAWEAKVRKRGDWIESTSLEYTGRGNVDSVVKKAGSSMEDLQPGADICTRR